MFSFNILGPYSFVVNEMNDLNKNFLKESINADIAPEPEGPKAHHEEKKHEHKEEVPIVEEDPESDIDLDMTGVVGKIDESHHLTLLS
jgi:hypothetical protein